jgi:hypothetical protein
VTTSIDSELFDVTLQASNVEELGKFYATLGLRKAVDEEDVKVFILGANELEIHSTSEPVDQSETILVQVDQLAQIEHRLQAAAIDYERPSQPDDLRVIVRDPNGNIVSFVAGRD